MKLLTIKQMSIDSFMTNLKSPLSLNPGSSTSSRSNGIVFSTSSEEPQFFKDVYLLEKEVGKLKFDIHVDSIIRFELQERSSELGLVIDSYVAYVVKEYDDIHYIVYKEKQGGSVKE